MKYPKTVLEEIKFLEKSLPKEKTGAVTRVLGSSLLVDETLTEEQRSQIVDTNVYRKVDYTLGADVNHERRMKKFYKKNGRIGYLLYFEQYVKPGPLKLQVWQQIAIESGKTLSEKFIKILSTPTEKPSK